MPDESLVMRQDLVIEFMKLGMDYDTACTAAEVSPEMKDQFNEDENFVQRKKFALSQVELELLKRLKEASEFACLKGDTKAIERRLELLRPDRYAKTSKVAHSLSAGSGTPKGFSISFVTNNSQPCEEEDPDFVNEG